MFRKSHFILFAALLAASCTASGDKDVPRVVNFVNFIREVEPRSDEEDITDILYETVRSEVGALKEYGFKGTWLLQYDALIDERYQELMKEEIARGSEVGGWWEITQPHV